MILGRLATSIRKQDWFTVLIETLIVVLGVFIGLQVNNWNEDLADRSREELYLSELVDDLNTDLGEIDSIIRTGEIRMAVLETILSKVGIEPRKTLTYDGLSFTFDPAPPFQSADPYEANTQLTNTPELDGARETFQALISTGDIGLISNRGLARKVQTYYGDMTEVSNLEASVNVIAEKVNDSRHRLGASLTGSVTTDDLAALAAADTQFRAELESYWTASAFQVRAAGRFRRDAEALIAAIEAERRQ